MNNFEKYKQIAFKIGIPLGILIFIIFIVISGSSNGEESTKTNQSSEMSLFDEDELIGTRYTDSVEDKLNIAVEDQNELKLDNKKMKEELESLKKIILNKENQSFRIEEKKENLYKSFPTYSNNNTPAMNTQYTNSNEKSILDKPKSRIVYKLMNSQNLSPIDINFGKIVKPKIDKNSEKKSKKIYIPTTAITQGELLHGLNLPTIMSKPMSVPVMITDIARFPSAMKLNIKKAMILVEGYGQLSDERGYFRFVRFIAYSEDGSKVYDLPCEGYLTSLRDNKKGLAGHVVSKQGEMLKRMFYAGAIEGASNIFSNASQTTMSSALGTTSQTSTNTTDKVKNILGGGLSTAAESAKDLYLEKAKNIFEVVEILKQDVGLVFTKGLILEPLDLDKKVEGDNDEKIN